MKAIPATLLLAISLLTAACSSTSSTSPSSASSAAIPANQGRITFYRPGGVFGYAQRADILLDGKKVGKSAPGTKFSANAAPGAHKVTVPNVMYSGENTLDVTVRNQETTYVKTSIGGASFGGRTNVEQVSAAVGAEDTADLKNSDE